MQGNKWKIELYDEEEFENWNTECRDRLFLIQILKIGRELLVFIYHLRKTDLFEYKVATKRR